MGAPVPVDLSSLFSSGELPVRLAGASAGPATYHLKFVGHDLAALVLVRTIAIQEDTGEGGGESGGG